MLELISHDETELMHYQHLQKINHYYIQDSMCITNYMLITLFISITVGYLVINTLWLFSKLVITEVTLITLIKIVAI